MSATSIFNFFSFVFKEFTIQIKAINSLQLKYSQTSLDRHHYNTDTSVIQNSYNLYMYLYDTGPGLYYGHSAMSPHCPIKNFQL